MKSTLEEIAKVDADDPDAIVMLGTASMSRDGHVREAAVRRLSEIESGRELPFLLLRANDWVDAVRDSAKNAIHERISRGRHVDFLDNLPLVLRLNDCRRADHSHLVASVSQMLTSLDSPELLIRGLRDDSRSIRRSCLQIAIDANFTEVVEAALDTTDIAIRCRAARMLTNHADVDRARSFVTRLLKDRTPAVRRIALRTILERFPHLRQMALQVALVDESSVTRRVAIRNAGDRIDAAGFYRRQAVSTNSKMRRLGLLGLAECGTDDDATLAAGMLEDEVSSVRAAAVTAISRLSSEAHAHPIAAALEDPSPSVVKAARIAIGTRDVPYDARQIRRAFETSPHEHVRRAAWTVLCNGGKWARLRYSLLGLLDSALADRSARSLQDWLASFNKSFSDPTAEELVEIRSLLDTARSNGHDDLVSTIQFYLPHPTDSSA
ncbi:MAG: hypothetical protein KDC95_05915 [Planctomycetes bacterium]|nr:hypothetical protein [Planctomycetota bacterium]